MRQSFLVKVLIASVLLFSTTGCVDIFNNFLFDDEEDVDPQVYIDQYFSQELQDKANTAKDVSYLTDEEKKVIFLCNLARLDGKKFADALFDDLRDSKNSYEKSLVETLDTTKNLPMLKPNEQLCKAAAFHAEDIGANGLVQHNSSDGTPTFTRIAKYYKGTAMGENISSGYKEAIFIMCQLLIDDGVPSLGHRKNILSRLYTKIGTAIRPHKKYDYCCVQDFSN